jgi:signal transduction histidine kinase
MEAEQQKIVFIQNVSHQIRTPLNIIMGFSQVLNVSTDAASLSDAVETEEIKSIASTIRHNSHLLLRMVLMLFDSSSTTGADELMANRHDEVSCNDVARKCIDYTYGHFPGVNVSLETELSDAVRILTNRLYLMRTIRELLYNAAKFSDGKHIKLYVTQNDTSVFFTVEDVGPGLAGNADELIYKPFAKIDDLTDGLGLGLPLTKRHALSLGGDLTYDDSYHGGCRFIIEMPK